MAATVDEVYANGNAADGNLIKQLLQLEASQEAEMVAARANMTNIVRQMHDPNSQMIDMLFSSLKRGKICVIDISQLRGTPGLILAGLILQRIFEHNQEEFTKAKPETIPVIAVIEEAQTIFGGVGSSGEGPFISWVKEGRKYDLGSIMITQQPGSIPNEILSQGDNWFIFHLLSSGDLQSVKKANAHFSDDLLSTLLNEPILGHCIYWSSSGGKSYPVPIRVLSFENLYSARDQQYNKPFANSFAIQLKSDFDKELLKSLDQLPPAEKEKINEPIEDKDEDGLEQGKDILKMHIMAAISKLKSQDDFMQRMQQTGLPWGNVKARLIDLLPESWVDRDSQAFKTVPQALNEIFGKNGWVSERRPSAGKPGEMTTWVVLKDKNREIID
jgi:hypothetical protein